MLKQTWLVLVLGVLFGSTLALTDQATRERIASNKASLIQELATSVMVGPELRDGAGVPTVEVKLDEVKDLKEKDLTAYRVSSRADGRVLGYAVILKTIGWDDLRILVGVSADFETILGIAIVDCRETPGLGEHVKDEAFRDQYKKSTAEPLELVKHPPESAHQVEALTGATISSQAVTTMVNRAVAVVKTKIKK